MTFRAGTTAKLYISTAAGAVTDVSTYADTTSVDQQREQLNVSVFGDAAQAFLNGQTSASAAVSGPLDSTMHTLVSGLISAGSSASWIYGPGGSVAAQPRMAGSLNVSGYSVNVAAAGRMEYSANLQITGAVANGTF